MCSSDLDYGVPYATAVEKLLASPAYGEKWARYWLDVVRFGETDGGEHNFERFHAWRYRDWVIGALNRDLPYDRFLQLQIAADKLVGTGADAAAPHASTADPARASGHPDLAALGFLTLGRRFLGNPQDIVDDQLDVILRGTQGLTIGCARCHDHKFDPEIGRAHV